MHTVKDARIFVESLNEDQRRALAHALLLTQKCTSTAIAARLCEAILLARAVHQVNQWKS